MEVTCSRESLKNRDPVGDSIWDLIDQITRGIDALDSSEEFGDELKESGLKLKRQLEIHRKCLLQEEELQKLHVKLLLERNMFLEKLKKIESFGRARDWEGDGTMLLAVREILYLSSDRFQLTDAMPPRHSGNKQHSGPHSAPEPLPHPSPGPDSEYNRAESESSVNLSSLSEDDNMKPYRRPQYFLEHGVSRGTKQRSHLSP
eukprot:Rmarinus@m.6966